MIMRQLFKTVPVSAAEERETDFFLDYYLLSKELQIEDCSVVRFGIEIYKRGRRPNGNRYFEYRKIFDLFGTAEEAVEVLELLSRNTVTPISLQEVLEDLLGVADFTGEAFFAEEAV